MTRERRPSRQRKKYAEKDISERWLLTYSDMITLLLGLFIIMYSISNVDNAKLQAVAGIIRGGFGLDTGGRTLVLDGNTGIIRDPDLVPKSQVYRLWEKLTSVIKKMVLTDKVLIQLQNKDELTLTIPASSLGEGKIKLPEETEELFKKLSDTDKEVPLEITVRVQIPYLENSDRTVFKNNWEYNAHRASIVAKYISAKFGIPEERISVQGLSQFKKSKETMTPEEEALDERLEIMVRKKE